MNIFNLIPIGFFNPLASGSNNRIYADCLQLIYDEYDREITFRMERDRIRDAIAIYLMDNHIDVDLDIDDYSLEQTVTDEKATSSSYSDLASQIIRKLASDEVGWLEEEIDESILEEMELNRKYRNKLRNWAIVALFACVGSFVAGYFVGHRQSEAVEPANMDEVAVGVQEEADSSAVATKDEASGAVAPDTMPTKSQPAENVAPVPVPVTTAPTPAATAPANDYSKYEQMDGRVRTGAYRIVGTAEEVQAKEGETVGRISRRYLGPDMECYVEVYNGLKASTQLKAGQTIKIPKLEVKKPKKKSSKN